MIYRLWDNKWGVYLSLCTVCNTRINFDGMPERINPETRLWEDAGDRITVEWGVEIKGKKFYDNDIVYACIDFGPGGEQWQHLLVKITPLGINLQNWVFDEMGYFPEVKGNIHSNPELLGE